MREGGRANALLVELLLVILFFMLSATTIVELFAGAKHKTVQARATSEAIMEAQNIADDLYGADDPDTVLKELGFSEGDGVWTLEETEYTLTVLQKEEETEAGILRTFTVSATGDGKDLFSLPSTRYLQKEVSP